MRLSGTESFGFEFDPSKRREIWRTLKKKGQNPYQGEHPAVSIEVHPKTGDRVPIWRQDPGTLSEFILNVVRDIHVRQGYTMTLRSLYYQLVGANYVPNHVVVYEVLSEFVSDMRLGGLIPWTAIEDRGRTQEKPYFEEGVAESLSRTIASYYLDRQEGQPIYLEVMAEKDAISNVVAPVCRRYGVPYTICRGFNSTSAIHDAYERFILPLSSGQQVKILYLGDHDPSGIQMREDIKSRLADKLILGQKIDLWDIWNKFEVIDEVDDFFDKVFYSDGILYEDWHVRDFYSPETRSRKDPSLVNFQSEAEAYAAAWIIEQGLEVVDVALTLDQIRARNLPPNPAKQSDANFEKYVERFDTEDSWELDAIPYKDLEKILRDAIVDRLDIDQYEEVLERERSDKAILKGFIDSYDG